MTGSSCLLGPARCVAYVGLLVMPGLWVTGSAFGAVDFAAVSYDNRAGGGHVEAGGYADHSLDMQSAWVVFGQTKNRAGSYWWSGSGGISILPGAAVSFAEIEAIPSSATIKARSGAVNYGGPSKQHAPIPGMGDLPAPTDWGWASAFASTHQYFRVEGLGSDPVEIQISLNCDGDFATGPNRKASARVAALVRSIDDPKLFFESYIPEDFSSFELGVPSYPGVATPLAFLDQLFTASTGLVSDEVIPVSYTDSASVFVQPGTLILVDTLFMANVTVRNPATLSGYSGGVGEVFANFDSTTSSVLMPVTFGVSLERVSLPVIVPEPGVLWGGLMVLMAFGGRRR